MRRSWSHPLIVLVLAVVAALGSVLLPGDPWVRIPFVLALAFLIPGYAVISALFPDPGRDKIRVFLLSFGVSLAISVVAAVELGGARHLNTTAWAGTLVGVTFLATIVMWRRGSTAVSVPRPPARAGRRLILPGVLVAAAIAILGGSIALARTPFPVPDDRGYTVLTIGPGPRRARGGQRRGSKRRGKGAALRPRRRGTRRWPHRPSAHARAGSGGASERLGAPDGRWHRSSPPVRGLTPADHVSTGQPDRPHARSRARRTRGGRRSLSQRLNRERG